MRGEVAREVGLEPGKLTDLGDGDSFDGVDDEHLGEEVFGVGREVGGEVVDSAWKRSEGDDRHELLDREAKDEGRRERLTVDLLEESRDVLVVEGKSTTKHNVEDHTTTPDIDLRSSVEPGEGRNEGDMDQLSTSSLDGGEGKETRAYSLSADDLRSSIVRTSTTGLEEISVLHDVGESEITDLDVERVVEKQADAGRRPRGVSSSVNGFERKRKKGRKILTFQA